MDDQTLISIIEGEEQDCDNSQLEIDRERALDYFYGRANGRLSPPDVPDRSEYVSRDTSDTIDWIMPALMKTFLGSDDIVEFSPVSAEDEPAAKQETEYTNYVITKQNNAYEVFSTWFDTALIQKNAYVYAYWKIDKDVQEEKYNGLVAEQLAMLMQDNCVEIVEAETEQILDPETGTPVSEVYNVKLARKNEKGHVCIENIPPELFVIANRHKKVNLSDAPFVGFDSYLSISELREMGFDVDDDINDGVYDESKSDYRYRYSRVFNDFRYDDKDPARRVVKVRYRWMRVDYDGDGIAELRYVMLVGNTLLVNEKASFIPIASITPRIIPHDHNGRSIAEVVEDLQELKTTLFRGLIDNVVLANNVRTAVDRNLVELDDLLVSRPGGVVRVNGSPAGTIMPLQHQMLGSPVMSAIEMIDGVKETRTGVTKYNMGTDSPSLNDTATGISIIHNAANQRIEWIANTFAETGVKELFLIVHALLRENQDVETVVNLRNQWVTVNPRQWAKRSDITINVGLGSTNRQVQMQSLMMIAQIQERAFKVGIVSPENIYNTTAELSKALGFKNTDKFFTHPDKMPKVPPKPDPVIEKAKLDIIGKEKELNLKREQMEFDNQIKTLESLKNFGEMIKNAESSEFGI